MSLIEEGGDERHCEAVPARVVDLGVPHEAAEEKLRVTSECSISDSLTLDPLGQCATKTKIGFIFQNHHYWQKVG